MAGFSRFLALALLFTALALASLGVVHAPTPAIAADDDIYVQPHAGDGDNAESDGRRDPDVIAPDKDGPTEDGTEEDRDEGSAPPGGCQFNNRPLELIV